MELSYHFHEVVSGEFPLERSGDSLVVLLETEESILDFLKRAEVVRRERLAFNDGEVDFYLVEPAGVDRSMHRDEIREGGFQAPNTWLAAMRRSVVHNPEHSSRVAIRRLGHDLGDE